MREDHYDAEFVEEVVEWKLRMDAALEWLHENKVHVAFFKVLYGDRQGSPWCLITASWTEESAGAPSLLEALDDFRAKLKK